MSQSQPDQLGGSLIVREVLEAQARFADGIDSTLDADFTGSATANNTALLLRDSETPPVLSALKRIDDTYTIISEKSFQARDASGYEVEVLLPPSQAANYPPKEKPRPIALPEQEWLLMDSPGRACDFWRPPAARSARGFRSTLDGAAQSMAR